MHTAAVGRPVVVVGRAHLVGVAEAARVGHVADGPDRKVFAHVPADRGGIVPGAVGEVQVLAEHVGQGLVDRPRLVQVDEARGVLGDAVGQLVGDHVIGAREGVAVDHLAAVPERVRVGAVGGIRAVPHGRDERQAGTVDAVAPETALVEVVGQAAEVVGLVDLADARGPLALGADARRGAAVGRAGDVLVVAHTTGAGRRDQVDLQGQGAGDGIDEHQLTNRHGAIAGDLEPPDEPTRGRRLADEARVVHPHGGRRGGEGGLFEPPRVGDRTDSGGPGSRCRHCRRGIDRCLGAQLAAGRDHRAGLGDLHPQLCGEDGHAAVELLVAHALAPRRHRRRPFALQVAVRRWFTEGAAVLAHERVGDGAGPTGRAVHGDGLAVRHADELHRPALVGERDRRARACGRGQVARRGPGLGCGTGGGRRGRQQAGTGNGGHHGDRHRRDPPPTRRTSEPSRTGVSTHVISPFRRSMDF